MNGWDFFGRTVYDKQCLGKSSTGSKVSAGLDTSHWMQSKSVKQSLFCFFSYSVDKHMPVSWVWIL